MKNGVEDKIYYSLLDWKDKNLSLFQEIMGGELRLCDLTIAELHWLYAKVVKIDFRTVAKEITSMHSHHLGTGKISPLKEGKTKSNVKESNQTERLAPPPPSPSPRKR